MITFLFLAFLGLMALIVGSIILHVVFGLILLPFKLGFAMFKGLFAALFVFPMLFVGFIMLMAFGSVATILGLILVKIVHAF